MSSKKKNKNLSRKGLSGGKKFGPPPKRGPTPQGIDAPLKTKYIQAMPKEDKVSYTDFERSGVIYKDAQGNPISKEKMYAEDELPDAPVESILEEETIEYIGGKKGGGMSCPFRRKGAKSNIQGVKDIQLKGGKFIGCK